jgi:enoyl-CoA hydratase
MAKMAVNVGMDTDINTGLLFERIAQTVAFSTGDRMEGTAAFMEKREAVFKGR